MKQLKRNVISPVVASLAPSGIRRFFDLVTEMDDVISLGVGEPDFVTPWRIREAAIYSLERGYTMYTSNYGLLELRTAVAEDLYNRYGVLYEPRNEVLITVGVSEAVDLALRAVVAPGDEVIIPEPCYVSYLPCTLLAGGKPVLVQTTAAEEFRLNPARLEAAITPRTRVLILSYPNNPTGATMEREDLEAIAALVRKYDLLVIADEIYAHLTYEGIHTCFASLPGMQEHTILLNGFSKAYAMTGWRVAYAAAHPDIIGAMTKIHQYTMLCAPIMAQKAALEALRHAEVDKDNMVEQYDQRRRLITKGLRDIGLPCFTPKGAFYVFPSIEPTGLGTVEFCERLLKEERVAVVPGNAFGAAGEGHIRCSYAASVEHITEALTRIGQFVARYR